MIFNDSDSDGESANTGSNPSQSLPVGVRPLVLQQVQQQHARERDRFNSLGGVLASDGDGADPLHQRSPSLPIAPQVNVEEVDSVPKTSRQRHTGAGSTGAGGFKRGHVKAPSADWSVDLAAARRGSPSDISFDSDSSDTPMPSQRRGRSDTLDSDMPGQRRVRSETLDSDIVLLTMTRDAMPMCKQGSEMSDTGSLIVPHARGMTFSDDSAEEGDFANREKKLLYLMVARCIAYPFNAKYQLETAPPKPKLNEDRFQNVVEMLDACRNQDWEMIQRMVVSLNSAETKCLHGERFLNCLDWYMDNVLEREDVVAMSKNGSFSVKELEAIFKVLATKHIMYTSKELDVDSGELQTWSSTFRKLVEHSARCIRPGMSGARASSPSNGNGGTGPNREKLYKLFQRILSIKSIEHQIIYRICQVIYLQCSPGIKLGRI